MRRPGVGMGKWMAFSKPMVCQADCLVTSVSGLAQTGMSWTSQGARGLNESSRTIVPAACLVTRFSVAAQSGANNPVRISVHNKACQTSGNKCAGIDVDSVRAEFRLFGWCMAVHDNLAEVELAVEKLITNP